MKGGPFETLFNTSFLVSVTDSKLEQAKRHHNEGVSSHKAPIKSGENLEQRKKTENFDRA